MTSEPFESDQSLCQILGIGTEAEANRAFACLYERHGRALIAFASSHGGRNQAEDVSQSVWQRLWPHLRAGKYDGATFRSLLFTTAKRIIVDQWRRQQKISPSSGAADLNQFPDQTSRTPAVDLLETERKQKLEECLGKLDAQHEQRAAVARLRLSSYAVNEICLELSLERKRVDKLWFEAKQALQQCVNRDVS